MTAGRGPHDADVVGIEIPFGGASAYGAHRAGRITQHDRMPIARRTKTIFQHEASNALFVEETRIVIALVIGQTAVPTAWADHERCSRGPIGFGQINGYSWNVLGLFAQRPGSSVRPESKAVRLG